MGGDDRARLLATEPGQLAGLLREFRQRALLTQERLAERARVSVGTIRGVEAGRIRRPRSGTVRLLAEALELTGHEREALAAAASGALPQSLQVSVAAGHPATRRLVPAQLPADVSGFTGRDVELAGLDAVIEGAEPDPAGGPRPVVISAVSGMAGVGKTALAVHWAHRAREHFPDGQLYVNLRGYDPDQPMTSGDALSGFLSALGVSDAEVPAGLAERAARFRSEVSDRRMLILLDNAASVEQVRPLLPGTSSCRVLITSRDSLAGLVALHGAHRIELDLLPHDDAMTLLGRLIGHRVTAEPAAAAAIADRCARLPLALRVAAERVAAQPAARLADLAAELTDEQRRLDLLDTGDDSRTAVKAVLSWSIRHLPPEAARVFRLLGLHPGPDFDPYAVAALGDLGIESAGDSLGRLARAHLVQPAVTGRYGMHDLLRAYAQALTTAHDPAADRRSAQGRLFGYYAGTAALAMDRLYPAEGSLRPHIAPPATPYPALAGQDGARTWLDAERAALVATAGHAVDGWPAYAVRLATTLNRYLDAGYCIDALTVHGHALAAAQQTGDPGGQAAALLGLGAAQAKAGRYQLAIGHLQRALALYQQTGDRLGQAWALDVLAGIEDVQGRFDGATACFRQALDLYRQAGDRRGEARGLAGLAIVEERQGRYGPAADHYARALAIFRDLGDQYGEAHTLSNAADLELSLGQYERAAGQLRQALALFRQLGDPRGEAWTLDSLGMYHNRMGQPGRAIEQFHSPALSLFRQLGVRAGETWALNGLGEASRAAGRAADALAYHTEALDVSDDTGARDQQARAHAGLGHLHSALRDTGLARHHYQQAVAIYTDLGMPDADDVHACLVALGPVNPDSKGIGPGPRRG